MKVFTLVAAWLAVSGAALAADLPVEARKRRRSIPWDIAFGGAVTGDYVFESRSVLRKPRPLRRL